MAQSLDGFVARPDHSLDWLTKMPTGDDDHGYAAFTATVDGIVMGRGSFQTVLSFDAWPYTLPVVVVSKTLTAADVPAELADKVRVLNLEPAALMAELDQQGWKRAYVDGGLLVQSFIGAGLIADITLTVAPILIGDGKRMFGPLDADIDLELVSTRAYDSGMTQTVYRLRPAAAPAAES